MPKRTKKSQHAAAATRKGRGAARGSATPERFLHLLNVLDIRLLRIGKYSQMPAEPVLREVVECQAVVSTLKNELLGG